jgi:SnoaL-like protein
VEEEPNMDESMDRIGALEARLRAVEDELALYRLMTSYGPAADTGDGEKASEIWTEDGVYDSDGAGVLAGRGAIAGMLAGEGHQAMVPGCAHVNTPVVIDVDGDRATAIGYSQVWRTDDGTHRVFRLAANRWEFARTSEGWRVVRRTNRRLDTEAAREILHSTPRQ